MVAWIKRSVGGYFAVEFSDYEVNLRTIKYYLLFHKSLKLTGAYFKECHVLVEVEDSFRDVSFVVILLCYMSEQRIHLELNGQILELQILLDYNHNLSNTRANEWYFTASDCAINMKKNANFILKLCRCDHYVSLADANDCQICMYKAFQVFLMLM